MSVKRKAVPDPFVTEVNVSIPVVLAELADVERMFVERVPVHVVDHLGPSLNTWAAYWPDNGGTNEPRIEIYRRFFSEDPDQRREEIRWVLRHEYQHALQRNFDEYAPRVDLGVNRWVGDRPLTVQRGGLSISLPGRSL